MDYKDLYLQIYKPTFQLKEEWIKTQLAEYKKDGRTYTSAEKRIKDKLHEEYFTTPENKDLNFFYEVAQMVDKKKTYYSDGDLNKIFTYEIQELYLNNSNLSIEPYVDFVQLFARFNAIYDVRIYFSRISRIIKSYYDSDELYRYKLEPVKDYKEFSDYNRLVKKEFPSLSKTERNQIEIDLYGEFYINADNKEQKKVLITDEQNPIGESGSLVDNLSKQKTNNIIPKDQDNIQQEINAIDPSVKLYLLRQLYHLPRPIPEYFSIPEFMKLLKILELSFDTSIFQKKPANVTAYRPINKGLSYYQHSSGEKIKSDAIKYLDQYGLKRFKEYITFHSK